jgi:hypothetical protein
LPEIALPLLVWHAVDTGHYNVNLFQRGFARRS